MTSAAVEEVATSITRLCRGLIALLLTTVLFAPIVEAAGIGLAVQQVDSTQFPKVRAYVSVADSQGVPITGLDNQAFQVLEDNKPITGFQTQPIIDSQEPVAVIFIMDVSGSMADAGKLDGAKQAASAYVDTMSANDSSALISFSDDVKILQGYTSDKGTLKQAIGQLQAKGDTAIYDAVIQASLLQGAVPQRRKIMLLMTDGADTRSKQSVDAAIAAAQKANAPVFVVGLGNDVKKDVLNKLASSTGGQAIYATAGDQLKQIFLSIGDQLRREYAVEYTSQLPADDSHHNLTIKATYRGQDSQGTGGFVATKPQLALDISGIANATKVSGTQHIQVTVKSGNVQQVQLLVDDQPQGTANAAPFNLDWDTTKTSAGIHKVIVRAKDSTGTTTDKEFAVEVANAAAPAPTPAAPRETPTTAAAPSPTIARTPVPTPTQSEISPLYYGVGAAVVIAALGGGILAFVLTRRPKVAVPPPPPTPAPPPPREQTVVTDRTEAIGLPPLGESTVVGGAATVVGGIPSNVPRLPRAKLIVVQNGAKSEVQIQQVETILGREAANPVVIRDPMSSRRHAKIAIENGEFWIEDLKSLNGTRVNGEVITRRKLATNDQIKIGEAILTFMAE